MIHPVVNEKLDIIRKILKDNNVKQAYLFGSAVTEDFREESDIDILINIDETLQPLERGRCYWDVLFKLEDTTNRTIDLVTMDSLSNPFFIEELNQTKVEIL